MGWKRMDVREQRVEFAVEAVRGEKPLQALCAEHGISRPTGYLWLKRYRESGIGGIAERSRRPKSSPAQTAWKLEEQVIALRLRYPDWGARKLQVVLAREGVMLTSSTVHRILLRYELVHERIDTIKPPRALNESVATSYGRWTSRDRRTGTARSGRCR